MKDNGLIIALDVDTPAQVRAFVGRVGNAADFYKLPPALVLQDPDLIKWLRGRGKKVFLDCKWYDIPSQVKRSVEQAGRMGVTACTVHLSAGREVLKAAMSAKPRPWIWGVSVLTSFSTKDLKAVGIGAGVRDQVQRLARVAKAAGLDGMVCSPQELSMLAKEKLGLTFVTPGIQWKKRVGKDQKRVASPSSAWESGAGYIVVGRAVLEAKDPVGAVRAILEDRPTPRSNGRHGRSR